MKTRTILLFSLLVHTISAQMFTELENSPIADVKLSAVAFADVDNDGDLDVVISGMTNFEIPKRVTELYLIDGKGNYTK